MSKKYTVVELRKICKDKGIKGYSKMRKAELMKHCLKKKSPKKSSPKVEKKDKKVKKKTSKKIDNKCNICRDPIKRNKVKGKNCEHKFHKICITQWKRINKQNECPICREKLN